MNTLVDLDLSFEIILEGNTHILDFIKLDKKERYGGYMYLYLGREYTDLFFHSSMEWLFPVIDKLERLGYSIAIISSHEDGKLKQRCQIHKGVDLISSVESDYKVTAIWTAVYNVCKLYNQSERPKLKINTL